MPANRHSSGLAYAAPDASARGSNQSGMRAHNERLVLTLIRQTGPLAKAEIARMSGLSAQTVSVIMRELEADGLLEKGEPVRGKVGQPSVPMGLVANGAFFFGLKIGRRRLDMVLTDFLGQVRGRVTERHLFPEPDNVVRFARLSIERLLGELDADLRGRVQGMGIALPFSLWDWADALEVDRAAMAGWNNRNIAAEIEQSCDFPVYLQNDATAACGGELVFGDPSKPADFLYFFIGFFAGGGLVLDNTLISGRTGNAAALGSMPIGGGQDSRRQLVDAASLHLLEQALDRAGHDGAMIWNGTSDWSVPEEIFNAWLEPAADGFTRAIIASCCVLDFEAVYLDGWMPEPLRRRLIERIARNLAAIDWPGIRLPQICEGTLGSDARALGAASIPLSDRFLVNRNALFKG